MTDYIWASSVDEIYTMSDAVQHVPSAEFFALAEAEGFFALEGQRRFEENHVLDDFDKSDAECRMANFLIAQYDQTDVNRGNISATFMRTGYRQDTIHLGLPENRDRLLGLSNGSGLIGFALGDTDVPPMLSVVYKQLQVNDNEHDYDKIFIEDTFRYFEKAEDIPEGLLFCIFKGEWAALARAPEDGVTELSWRWIQRSANVIYRPFFAV